MPICPEPIRRCGRLATRSPAMHELIDAVERFARTDVTVSLMGETGAGKEVMACALHELSARSKAPFVTFDCGAVAANLAESELLGHERGSFTGAVGGHAGAFERAHGGTLFLDEVAELPLDLQSRLLRALESRKIRRVGGRHEHGVDVRVVCATHRDLRALVAGGTFREDLYFRLAVAVVSIPPLRARLEDLPLLVRSMLADLGHKDMQVADAAYEVLCAHSWPGNVRELKNALACAVAFVDGHVLLPRHIRLQGATRIGPADVEDLPLGGQTLDRLERAAIRQTLAKTQGSKTDAARVLGIAVSTLYEKLRKHRL